MRPRLGSKHKVDPELHGLMAKTPKLDSKYMFDHLKVVKDNLVVVRGAVSDVLMAGKHRLQYSREQTGRSCAQVGPGH